MCRSSSVCYAPDPAKGAYSAPADPLAVFKGLTSKGRRGKEEGKGRGGGRGKGGESCPPVGSLDPPVTLSPGAW